MAATKPLKRALEIYNVTCEEKASIPQDDLQGRCKGIDLLADTVTFIPCLLKTQDYSTTSQSPKVYSGALNPLKFVFSYCHSWFTFKQGKYDSPTPPHLPEG